MEYCTVLNRKSAGMYFNVGCTYSPDGFIIDLMFISHTDVSHTDAVLKRGLRLAIKYSTFTKKK